MRDLVVAAGVMVCLAAGSSPASGQAGDQRFDLGMHVASTTSGPFDDTDVGVGGRVAWHALPLVGIEAEFTFYPADFPGGRAFSRRRLEGLFGVTVGPTFGPLRPFARFRPGFLDIAEAPGPFPCILIYPPPLNCALAAGGTLAAFDLGGGVEVAATRGLFVRVDAGDRMVRYRGPVFAPGGQRRDDAFYGHDFRLTVGAGLRF